MALPPKRFVDLSLLALVVWLIGFFMAGFGGHELLQSLRCGATPTTISCTELDLKGAPENKFVTLTDFQPKRDGYVYYADERDGHWMSVDMPLVAPHSTKPPVVAILYQVGNQQNLFKLLAEPTLTGMLIQRGLRGDSAAALRVYCPGIDTDACWVLQVGTRPQSRLLMGGVFVGGLFLHTLAIFLFARPRPRDNQGTAMAAAHMSPLLMLVNGLHALAYKLPLSRRVWGLILFPPAMALAVYGGQKFYLLASGSMEGTMEADLLAVGGLIFGVTFSLLGLSFLAFGSNSENETELAALIVRPGMPANRSNA